MAEALETNDKIYDLYPPVAQCPPVQTRIAFKLLQLNEDFCPTMSEFKEGTVTAIDSSTGELAIQLDRPLETVFDQPSKFFAPPEDQLEGGEGDEQEASTMVTGCLSATLHFLLIVRFRSFYLSPISTLFVCFQRSMAMEHNRIQDR